MEFEFEYSAMICVRAYTYARLRNLDAVPQRQETSHTLSREVKQQERETGSPSPPYKSLWRGIQLIEPR
jgi:hypothetical protein